MQALRQSIARSARCARTPRPLPRARPAAALLARRFASEPDDADIEAINQRVQELVDQGYAYDSPEVAREKARAIRRDDATTEAGHHDGDGHHDAKHDGHHEDHHGEHHGDHHGDHHGHHEHTVKEPLGIGFWVIAAIIPTWMAVYHLSQPDAEGNLPYITRAWARYQERMLYNWKTQQDMQNAVIQEAGHERHLLYYPPKPAAYELNYPEIFETGSRRSVPAGHYINLDKVKAHYRQKYMEEEERKANRLRELETEPPPASSRGPTPKRERA